MQIESSSSTRNQGGTPGQPSKKKYLWRLLRALHKWAIRFIWAYEFYEKAVIVWGVFSLLATMLITSLDWPSLALKFAVLLLHHWPFIKVLLWVAYQVLRLCFAG